SKQKIRIGQIGTSHAHASGKIQTIRGQFDIYELVGVVEPDKSRRESLEQNKAYSGVTWITEKQLLQAPGLQAVAIETEVAQLIPTANRALEAGLHIHLDKPAGDNLPDFQKLLRIAEKKKRVVQMGYMLRYNPAFQFMYRAVREGWFGNIMEVDCMMGKLANENTRQDIGAFSGGGMFELGGHVIDSIVYMLGKPLAVSAFTRRTQADGIADNQLAVLEYPQATATVRINHRDPFGSPRRRFQIAGDKGGMEIQQLESGNFTLFLDEARGDYSKGTHSVSLDRDGGRYDGEFRDLAMVLRGEKPFAWSYQHDLDTHETLLRASEML
ncbi:MAG: Gfo/Idh/MocA family oxidoreductase, partial [Verrucomicrobiae bacterium]|nr:Gfo/Idh/MocA family oxidoreductase [Verrucomicrobiae bacterium]